MASIFKWSHDARNARSFGLPDHLYYLVRKTEKEQIYYLSILPGVLIRDNPNAFAAIAGKFLQDPNKYENPQFIENETFVEMMHKTIVDGLLTYEDLVDRMRAGVEKYIYLIDKRTPSPQGEVPPEDIYGCIEMVEDGSIDYTPNPNYKIYGKNGFFYLCRPVMYDIIRNSLLVINSHYN